MEQPIRRGELPGLGPIRPAFTSVVVVLGLLVSLAIPVVRYPGVPDIPTGDPVDVSEVSATGTFEGAPRCDTDAAPDWTHTGERLTVALEGNSIAGEMIRCLGEILAARNIELVNERPHFLECEELPEIREEAEDPAERPDAAILFTFTASSSECGEPWYEPIDDLVEVYRDNDILAFLTPGVPTPPDALNTFKSRTDAEYQHYGLLAADAPEEVTFVDAGRFVRGDDGQYLWRMPCVAGGEPGCDEEDTVGVRFRDGVHFCTDPAFRGSGCPEVRYQGGQNRVAAAIAAQVLPRLEEKFG